MKRPTRRTWCPKAIGAIGDLGEALGTRSITLWLTAGTPVERWQGLPSGIVEARGIRETCATLSPMIDEVVPEWLSGRDAQIWTPLVSIAAAAGGDWLEQMQAASVDLRTVKRTTEKRSNVAQVESIADRVGREYAPLALRDLAAVFVEGETVLRSVEAIERMKAIRVGPWRTLQGEGLTPTTLAALVERFGVGPVLVKVKRVALRGYRRAAVEKAMAASFASEGGM